MNVGFAALTTRKGSLEALEYLFENGHRASGNYDWTLDLLARSRRRYFRRSGYVGRRTVLRDREADSRGELSWH